MRISDWSSDVCSSDLLLRNRRSRRDDRPAAGKTLCQRRLLAEIGYPRPILRPPVEAAPRWRRAAPDHRQPPLHPDRQRRPRLGERQAHGRRHRRRRSEEHTSELQSLMRISYAVFCLKKKKKPPKQQQKQDKTKR